MSVWHVLLGLALRLALVRSMNSTSMKRMQRHNTQSGLTASDLNLKLVTLAFEEASLAVVVQPVANQAAGHQRKVRLRASLGQASLEQARNQLEQRVK